MKGVKHYLKNGTEFKGKTHKMIPRRFDTGATHTASSKKLFHFKDIKKTKKKETK